MMLREGLDVDSAEAFVLQIANQQREGSVKHIVCRIRAALSVLQDKWSAYRRRVSHACRCPQGYKLSLAFCRHARSSGFRATLRRSLLRLAGDNPPPVPVPPQPDDAKAHFTRFARIALDVFLSVPATLEFPVHTCPSISIILVLYNRAELTLACLQSLLATAQCTYEVILVDNASTDETGRLLERIHGAQIVRNPENRGYPVAVNQA